ncbi:ABC transporter permease [Methylocystis sp. WRRC1]|uniref:ABC transporter permease n=1 Tax=Methylocystis sp. WRRC1 TaxID=1732014 RepID=UPI001D14E582|nr:ABC transporter permease [Methylocystis sp. WRRC1]MCC3243779.1 ABC transporter permease [Methylocystis sp. WRRC1]
MEWLESDQDVSEMNSVNETPSTAASVVNFPTRQISSGGDNAAAALNLVAEAAAAIKGLEEQAAEAVARAHNVADAVVRKLELADARAERAETAQLEAEAKIVELTAALEETRNAFDMLQSRLAAKEAELIRVEQRASLAERRADEANVAIQSIVEAIRTQLPVRTELDPDEAGTAA